MRPVPTLPSALIPLLLLGAPAAAQLAPPQPVFAPAAVPLTCEVYSAAPMIEAQLFFGRNIGADVGVSDHDWAEFLDGEVTPRFPNGLTVIDASGHWRDSENGRLIREPSKVLTLLAESGPATLTLLREIVDSYKERFHQQSVGLAIRPVCVSF
ncbi:DUF3574 domain-containing protein [Azospirillum ramasamyi]|uniref:DUF3574 domain-containing protein n=1 Tax=Azospirillum ramasamyi TaxID=682998 RepID=A0A2U9S6T3_9PROT|nr:DUF3574 domain-containing protein [Azospirillum ramasamyi]AWU94226.1 DUF3574 domain-containing protein [Azospirillum ramasamyi]